MLLCFKSRYLLALKIELLTTQYNLWFFFTNYSVIKVYFIFGTFFFCQKRTSLNFFCNFPLFILLLSSIVDIAVNISLIYPFLKSSFIFQSEFWLLIEFVYDDGRYRVRNEEIQILFNNVKKNSYLHIVEFLESKLWPKIMQIFIDNIEKQEASLFYLHVFPNFSNTP